MWVYICGCYALCGQLPPVVRLIDAFHFEVLMQISYINIRRCDISGRVQISGRWNVTIIMPLQLRSGDLAVVWVLVPFMTSAKQLEFIQLWFTPPMSLFSLWMVTESNLPWVMTQWEHRIDSLVEGTWKWSLPSSQASIRLPSSLVFSDHRLCRDIMSFVESSAHISEDFDYAHVRNAFRVTCRIMLHVDPEIGVLRVPGVNHYVHHYPLKMSLRRFHDYDLVPVIDNYRCGDGQKSDFDLVHQIVTLSRADRRKRFGLSFAA